MCTPLLDGKELEYLTDCIKSSWVSSKGHYIQQFEEKFSSYCGCRFGVTTTNGTSSIHLALASVGIGEGDEVFVPAFTMIGSVVPVLYCGAKPVLIDCDPQTWTMDVGQIEAKLSKKTRAILPVHIYGHPCDMDPIMALAKEHDLFVIADAAEAHGAEYKGRKTGGLGDVGCFSFYANKIITCGEGGMMVTNDEQIAKRALSLKNLSFSTGAKRVYLHDEVGFNYRLTNLQAAVGLAQFERIDDFVEMRRKNASLYAEGLGGIAGIKLPCEKEWAKNVFWMFSILVGQEFGASRDKLIAELSKMGIDTRPFFVPMHQQPAFQRMGMFKGEKYPVSESVSCEGLLLPSGSGLKSQEIKYVCDAIRAVSGES